MANGLRNMVLRPRVSEPPLCEAIRDVCARMQALETQFSMQNDCDMIEACIYEMESLRAQYRFLLRKAKEEGITGVMTVPLWGE